MTEHAADIAVIGGGIVGLTHTLIAARGGASVVLFERREKAQGASIRNFGMIWPVGQSAGVLHRLALRSRQLWQEFLDDALLPYFPKGSLHVAYRADEDEVLREFAALGPDQGFDCTWLSPEETVRKSPCVREPGLLGALWSPTELTVDPRAVVAALPSYLAERFNVNLRFGQSVRSVNLPWVETATERWKVERAIVCGGDDFETLYPEVLGASGIARCKLQMMRTAPQPGKWRLGPSLAAGLTLRFYPAFQLCPSLPKLRERIAAETPEYDRWGIHVLVAQTERGEITLGDSHEYGREVDIFDKPEIDRLILDNLQTFAMLPDPAIAERWHGVYAKHPTRPYFAESPAPGVQIITATGGSGMTLSFGLAEQTFKTWSH